MNAGRDRYLILLLTVCGLLAGVTLPSPAYAMSKAEQRKLESAAKKAFYSSDYEKAKEIYSTLISEFDDYIYLRNIARCYEQMKQPGPALDNFKAYLKRAGSSLSEKEKQEITERVAAMEKLVAEAAEAESKKQAAAPQAAQELSPASGTPPPKLPLPAPEASQPATAPGPALNNASAGSLDLSGQPQPSAQPSALRPLGFALLITSGVAALVGGVLMYSAWSTYGDNKDGKCGDATGCANARNNVDTQNLWSKISFGVAAGAAMLGGTFLFIAPSPRPSRDVAIGMGWTY
jgi:hypothetical protein